MKIPNQIRAAGRNYSVTLVEDKLESGSVGLTDHLKQEIRLMSGLLPVEEADTLLHEVLHVVYHLWHITPRDKEEDIVRKIATGLTAVLQDNPDFGKYISEIKK